MATATVDATFNARVGSKVWIYSPAIDLVIGCGAWSAPLLLLATLAATSKTAQWSFAFYLLALLFNYPHFMATAYRAYRSYDELTKYRFYTIHVALLLGCAGLLAHVYPPALPWIFTLYICWSPWHYTGQNFGLAMMFARRAELQPGEGERRALHLAFIASYLMLLLSFETGASGDAMLVSLGLPWKATLPARIALALFFLAASGWALVSLSRRGGWKAVFPTATLVSTQFLWFLLPAIIEVVSGKEVPQTRYSSGILAVLHSAQYLWITSYYQQKEARAAGQAGWSFWRYLLTLVAGGIALFVPGPWIVSRVFHADFGASFLTFTALVNLHHFLLDGAIWKLRDSRIARFLLNTSPGSDSTVEARPSGLARAMQWLAGATPAARAVRIGAVAILLIWGVVDRLHFYWGNVSADRASLERAARLNPEDSTVLLRLARAQSAAGDSAAALGTLEKAASVGPSNLIVQQAYAQALVQAGRESEAYAVFRRIVDLAPKDAVSLQNYGLVAQHLGHGEEALDSWRRAADADPGLSSAQLYLAQALEQRGETLAAARHYQAYLQIVAKDPKEHAGESGAVISALIKVADADAAAQQFAAAKHGYEAAIGFAEKVKDPQLQSLALAHLAEANDHAGNAPDAMRTFQQALRLDGELGNTRAASIDWLNYANFLHRRAQAEKLVLACYLKAEELERATPGETLSIIVKAREASESRAGAETSRMVRAHLDSVLAEALSLQLPASMQAQR